MAPSMRIGKMSTTELVQNRENGCQSDSVRKMKKVQVNVLSMNIPIKRRSVGSTDERSDKKVFIMDGDKQISVNNEVDKVICKFCKPKQRFFKNTEILRYHLVRTHNVSSNSSHYQDPTLSPFKVNNPQQVTPNKNQIPLKLPEIQNEDEEKAKEKENEEEEEALLKSRNTVELRRMRGKKNSVVNSRTDKIQPACSFQTIKKNSSSLESEDNRGEEGGEDDSDQNFGSEYDYYFSVSPNPPTPNTPVSDESPISEKSPVPERFPEPRELSVSSPPFQGSPPSSCGASKQNQPRSGRRQSERRFEGLKPYRCNHCELSYSSLENKRLHEQTHTEKTEVCVFCDMRFYFQRGLRRHLIIHTKREVS